MNYSGWKCWSILAIGGVPASLAISTKFSIARTEMKADTVNH